MDMTETLTRETTVAVTAQQVSSNLAGEEVILQLESGIYYGLDDVGTFIWEMVQQPHTVGQICDAICAEYEVQPAQCFQDTAQFLSGLIDAQLVEVR